MKKFLIIFFLFFLILLYINPFVYFRQSWTPFKYKHIIKTCAQNHALDWRFVAAVVYQESRFKHKAQSIAGAHGLMQLLPETANEMSAKLWKSSVTQQDLFNPYTNIDLGCAYLKRLMKYFNNNKELALAAYNAGIGNVIRWIAQENISVKKAKYSDIRSRMYPETREYVKKIMRMYGILVFLNRIRIV